MRNKALTREITIKASSHPVFCVSTTRLKIRAVTEVTAKAQNVQETMRISLPWLSAFMESAAAQFYRNLVKRLA